MKRNNSIWWLIFVVFIIIVGQNIVLQYFWSSSDLIYAIAFVKGKGGGAGPSKDIYHYEINKKKFTGSSYGIEQGQRYIVVVPSKQKSSSELVSNKIVDHQGIEVQPLGGWAECPINEDGTIKEKYKRRSLNGKTEENNIKGIEFSAKDSAQVTKESIEFLKKHN